MKPPARTKYLYKIRSRNGAVVEKLQIYGETAEAAQRKLMQMYIGCEILEETRVEATHNNHEKFEDVIDLIIKNQ